MSKQDIKKWYASCNTIIGERLESFLEQFYPGSNLQPLGDGFRLQPCPRCGHSDCSTVSSKGVVCYSCGWSGNYLSSYLSLQSDGGGLRKKDAIRKIEAFCGLNYPVTIDPKRRAEEERLERIADIRNFATDFYSKQLIETTEKFQAGNGKKMNPLQYLQNVRGRTDETLRAFRVGFAINYLVLEEILLEEEYTKDDIFAAGIWIPEGLIVYPQWDPYTREVLRFNTKNPFGVTHIPKGKTEPVLVQGFSSGEKVLGFAPGFSFKKRIIIVEGENDAQAVYESAWQNVVWIAGQLNDTQLSALRATDQDIYLMVDNDEPGRAYIDKINLQLPDKRLFVIKYDEIYNDPDVYYQRCPSPTPIDKLFEQAEPLETEGYIFDKTGKAWTIENRHRRIHFDMDYIDNRTGSVVGKASLFKEGKFEDSKANTALAKLPKSYKPFSLFLDDHINAYYNAPEGLDKKTMDDLVEIYMFSKYKNEVVRAMARRIFEDVEHMEKHIVDLNKRIGADAVDEVLKEINDLQNKGVLSSLITIPTIKLSQFFSVKNNDAYFYFTDVKSDGTTVRRIPFLLRNDGAKIRLDLYKRKDSQCLLLIDNKYELPEEVNEAKIKLSETSLIAEWANRYSEGGVSDAEISPHTLVCEIERYIRQFYYHKNTTVYKILSLWILGTYYYELFGQYPYLFLNGEKGSGKTMLDLSLYMFSLNAKLAVNISDSALFRLVSLEGGTIILDEIENLTSRGKTQDNLMATLLKGGYQRGSKVYRQNMETNATEGFEVFSPKVISNIYGVEDVIEDRCIRIDSFRMKIREGFQLEDPKYYLNEAMEDVRSVTSRCVLCALRHFQTLNNIYKQTKMITDNARLTQLLSPILSLAKFVDYSAHDPGFTRTDSKTDFSGVTGEFTKAFYDYYNSSIRIVKDDIEQGTPEGNMKDIINTIAHELAGAVPKEDKVYTIPSLHKYPNEIKYDPETGEFWLDAIHMKVFMEEILIGWSINPKQIHGWMKTSFGINEARRRSIKLDNSSAELTRELRNEHSMKVYHYPFNVKDFVAGHNKFIDGIYDEDVIDASNADPF